MIRHIKIQNFAIVDSINMPVEHGLTVITGETGAGKSIGIDALSLCIGARAESGMVRSGQDKAMVEVDFDIAALPRVTHWLKALDLEDFESPDTCIIRRIITAEGRSIGYVNGHRVTNSQLKELGQRLINIHGQHAHQRFLKASEQLDILDRYGAHEELLAEVKQLHRHYQERKTLLNQLSIEVEQFLQREQLLNYQLSELEEMALEEHEFDQLEQEFKRLNSAADLQVASHKAFSMLYDDDDVNVSSLLNRVTETLSDYADIDDRLGNIISVLDEAQVQIDEASRELRQYNDNLDIDPERLLVVEQRFMQYNELARKHQVAPQQLYQTYSDLRDEFESLSSRHAEIAPLKEELKRIHTEYIDACCRLHQRRAAVAQSLSEKITSGIRVLNMANATLTFNVELREDSEHTQAKGLDQVSVWLQSNLGQAAGELDKVASGGELSRIGLTIQALTSSSEDIPVMIFDEVDTGISGPTATQVAKLLRQLGEEKQVLCVTHLPQVAAGGHHQWLVNKIDGNNRTTTEIHALSPQQRIDEVARLVAGDTLTESAINNARDLLRAFNDDACFVH